MKKLIVITFLTISSLGYSQFEVTTVETAEGIETLATCNSMSNNTWSKPSYMLLRKTTMNDLYMQFYYLPFSAMINDKSSIDDEHDMVFVFYDASNNKKHTYYAKTGGYLYTGKGYLLYINDEKLITYFKKYSYVYAIIDGGAMGDWKYKFSLKGFTKACAEIMK